MNLNFHERVTGEQSERSSDRAFGLIFSVFLLIVAIVPVFRGRPLRVWAIFLSPLFLTVSLIRPGWMSPLSSAWHRFGLLTQRITNPIIMAILYFIVITPFGILMRLLGRDILHLKWDSDSSSYWIVRQPPGPAPDSMRDQF